MQSVPPTHVVQFLASGHRSGVSEGDTETEGVTDGLSVGEGVDEGDGVRVGDAVRDAEGEGEGETVGSSAQFSSPQIHCTFGHTARCACKA
jgi:hypothetical protein